MTTLKITAFLMPTTHSGAALGGSPLAYAVAGVDIRKAPAANDERQAAVAAQEGFVSAFDAAIDGLQHLGGLFPFGGPLGPLVQTLEPLPQRVPGFLAFTAGKL